jgi:hypothetical protein
MIRCREANLHLQPGKNQVAMVGEFCTILIALPKFKAAEVNQERQQPQVLTREAATKPHHSVKLERLPDNDDVFRRAFGEHAQEHTWEFKASSGMTGVAVATKECRIEPDGRVALRPCSVVQFGKWRLTGGPPVITTIRSNRAWIICDGPAVTADDAMMRMTAIEFEGGLRIRFGPPTQPAKAE